MAVIVVTLLLFQRTAHIVHDHYRQQIPDAMWPVAITGWVVATYAPIGLAVLFRRWARRVSTPWALHLALFPVMVALLWIGEALMLSVIEDPDFDATIGGPVMPALLLFLIAACGYFGALILPRHPGPDDRKIG